MKTLELFNAVIEKSSNEAPYVSSEGFIIMPSALWAKSEIESYWKATKLSGVDLNSTFHKSWNKILTSTREELLIDQILHYISTYGTGFTGEVYLPNETVDVPDTKISFKVFRGYSKDELTKKSLDMLRSGVALQEDTIDDLLIALTNELSYQFTGDEGIRNKEAVIKIADMYGVIPNDTMEFFRYIIYRMTGETLIIKNVGSIEAIKNSTFNPTPLFEKFGLEKLAAIFNRFKPLFLAMKKKNSRVINKISKLSKTYHTPLVTTPLNTVTYTLLTEKDTHWLDNATPYAIFKAISACYTRLTGQDTFLYRIRNGKSWYKTGTSSESDTSIIRNNFLFMVQYLAKNYSLEGKKFFIPRGINFALPTSEKMFVGNIPTGTKFTSDKMAVGVYWENAWGANDIDVSATGIFGKIGWNTSYNHNNGTLMYSGDVTSAPNGAVEYMYARTGLSDAALIQNNIYSGDNTCSYKIIVGTGDGIDRDYMMNPNNLMMEVKTNSIQKQNVIGMMIPEENGQVSFVILNFGAGQVRVSSYNQTPNTALYQQWKSPLTFNVMLENLGAIRVDSRDEADMGFDFSLDTLEKDSFMKIFSK